MEIILAFVGLILVMGGWLDYLRKIPKEHVPIRPLGHVVIMWVGILLATTATVKLLIAKSPFNLLLFSLALITILLAGFFLYLLSLATLPDGESTVVVGDAFIPFEATDDAGQPFSTDTWQGKRVLFKIFRGHW